MRREFGAFEIDDTLGRVDFAAVHAWLTDAYWSSGIARERVERAARGSALVVSAWEGDRQVGYLRVISDMCTFGYICDVIVDEAFRGKGIGRAMVRFALDHPDMLGFRRWMLATRDAHGVYAPLGFKPLPEPDRWMERKLIQP